MANSSSGKLRRQYRELKPDERVKLMNAADLRGDKDEFQSLMISAPRVAWDVKHHYGIRTALTDLEIVAALSLCHLAGELFRFMFLRMARIGDVDNVPEGDMETLGRLLQRNQLIDDNVTGFSGALLGHWAAWQELAAEWSLDERGLLDAFGMVESALDCARHYVNDADVDSSAALAELRRFVELRRAEWE